MTTASSNLPPTVNFQYNINSTGTSIVAYGDGSSPFVLLNGSIVAFSIYFSEIQVTVTQSVLPQVLHNP